jgi:hypothetical protein
MEDEARVLHFARVEVAMRRHFLLIAYLVVVASMLASAAAPADPASVQLETPAPTYMNAEVVRTDASASTITIKSESGENVLQVEGQARNALADLKAGDKVIVTYRVLDGGASGGGRRVVVQLRPASPSSGEPGPAPVAAPAAPPVAPPAAPGPKANLRTTPPVRTTPVVRTIERAHIVLVEPATNKLTIKDSLGRTHVFVVQEGARQDMGVLMPGEEVSIGVQGSPEQVVQIQRGMTATPPTAGSVVDTGAGPVAVTSSELEAIRLSAAQDFEGTAARLSTQANAIDGLWLGFQEACLTEPPPTNRSRGWFQLLDGSIPEPGQDGCRQQYQEIIQRGERVREAVKLAEDTARKAEVVPGVLRETLERHRLDF